MPSVHHHALAFDGDAFGIFCIFKDQPHAFFLDSSLHRSSSQFSYIGFLPFTTVYGNLDNLLRVFKKYQRPSSRQDSFLDTGAVGYLGYDGSLFFGFYDTIIRIDHRQKKLIIASVSKARINDIVAIIKQANSSHQIFKARKAPKRRLEFKSNFTKPAYLKAVRKALEHIRQGDIYQINLSHQITVNLPQWRKHIQPVDIFKHLREAFPSEFGAYFDDGKQVILSASPERFLKLQDDIIQVKPMKGTRPRGKTKAQDKALKAQLLKDPKEIAELLMVTDLERNDLGRVCDYGSVKVTKMRTIETYAPVFQATSTIQGRLSKEFDQFDLLKATFPSGSVTGCPKIEAMKIIKQLERGPRGLYTGALGYMRFGGGMDFNVMIRTMFLNENQITFHVGGGIVADSDPEREWQETWDKAKPLMETLKKTFE